MAASPMDLARDERGELADTLAALDPGDWDAPTLCEGWRVRDVVAHVVSYEGIDRRRLVRRFVEGRFSPDRINQISLDEHRSRPPAELVDLVRRHRTPSGLTAGFGGTIALTDTLIHHQDIRIPLGLHREVPLERLRATLPFAMVAPPLRGAWKARGLRVVATDLDWSFGRGPEVRAPGQVLLMAVAGRGAVAGDLSGPGADTLRRRLA